MDMRQLVADLEQRRAEVRKMGGEERIKKQHERGKTRPGEAGLAR